MKGKHIHQRQTAGAPRRRRRVNYGAIAAITALLAALVIGVWSLVAGYFVLSPGPHIHLSGAARQEIAAFDDYADPGATARGGGLDLTDQIRTEGSVNPEKPGQYAITYRVTWHGRIRSARREVTVVDREAPVLTLAGESGMTVSLYSLYQEPGYTAADRCDGDLTAQVQVTDEERDGVHTLTYTVTDQAGNKASAVRTVTVRDVVPPTVELLGEVHTYVALGGTFHDAGVTASDDADGDLTAQVTRRGSVDTSTVGVYELTYRVTDRAGNEAVAVRTVTVCGVESDCPNRVYLTFDDGPSQRVTPRVLDTLKHNGIHATFFILNYSDGDKPLIRRMIDEGHTIGLHGYSHDYAAIYASDDAFMENIYRLRDRLREDFGYEATVIRFPGGASNTVSRDYSAGIMSRLARRVEAEGFTYFDWNVSSGDANSNTLPSGSILKNVTGSLRTGRSNVVLMHDAATKTTTADALQGIIDYGHAHGYVFLPITRDTVPVHHGIAN